MPPKRGYGTTPTSTSTAGGESSAPGLDDSSSPSLDNGSTAARTTRWQPIIIMLTMLGLDALSNVMCLAPQTQLFEQIVCRKHYSSTLEPSALQFNSTIFENRCKAPEVQDVVAQLFGWQACFDGIPGLLLAMYFGVLADKHGRRPVMFLSKIGMLLAMSWVLFVCWLELPLRLIWISSLFTIVGGGGTVASSVCMMVLTDSTTEENRSQVFFQTNAVLIVSELIGPALSTLMMQNSVWLPLLFALACTILTTILSGFMPETLPPTADNKTADGSSNEDSVASRKARKSMESAKVIWKHASGTLSYIAQTQSVLLLVISFLVVDFSRQSLTILLQYVSIRYSTSISKANILISCRSFAQLVTFTIILPILDTFMVKRLGLAPKTKDLRLALLSISLLMLSFAVLVLAPNLWIVIVGLVTYTLGSGFGSFARSLVSSLVEPHMIGTLFTTLAMMDTTGSLLAGPMVAGSFSWSMRLSGIWRGMPYIFSFILCALATLALARVRLSVQPLSQSPPENEESRVLLDEEAR
ncbi:MFS general substrate transporter [Tolypocladium paradoxum]|uniref:MFS general substrate transporter n=1 Tax=Tolypocladium paradoxum TaxID=94208 RepID=A0A2S4KSF0_9HYPO|nr:MFS general substrate transporter [Tolypocladium paradoxum]